MQPGGGAYGATTMNPVWLAQSRLRRRKFDECVDICTSILDKNPYDQVCAAGNERGRWHRLHGTVAQPWRARRTACPQLAVCVACLACNMCVHSQRRTAPSQQATALCLRCIMRQ